MTDDFKNPEKKFIQPIEYMIEPPLPPIDLEENVMTPLADRIIDRLPAGILPITEPAPAVPTLDELKFGSTLPDDGGFIGPIFDDTGFKAPLFGQSELKAHIFDTDAFEAPIFKDNVSKTSPFGSELGKDQYPITFEQIKRAAQEFVERDAQRIAEIDKTLARLAAEKAAKDAELQARLDQLVAAAQTDRERALEDRALRTYSTNHYYNELNLHNKLPLSPRIINLENFDDRF